MSLLINSTSESRKFNKKVQLSYVTIKARAFNQQNLNSNPTILVVKELPFTSNSIFNLNLINKLDSAASYEASAEIVNTTCYNNRPMIHKHLCARNGTTIAVRCNGTY